MHDDAARLRRTAEEAPVSARRQAQREAGNDSTAIKLGVFGGEGPLTRIEKLSTAVQRRLDPASAAAAVVMAPPHDPKATVVNKLISGNTDRLKSKPTTTVVATAVVPLSARSDAIGKAVSAAAAPASAGALMYGAAAAERNDLFATKLEKEKLKRLLLRCANEQNKFGDVVQRPHVFDMVWAEAQRIDGGHGSSRYGEATSVDAFRQALVKLNI
jgi:hypothetical protein